jgi:heme/copper-type cytochrome/quinol oxidase subunit 3
MLARSLITALLATAVTAAAFALPQEPAPAPKPAAEADAPADNTGLLLLSGLAVVVAMHRRRQSGR